MPGQQLFELMAKVTVARLLEREDFTRRIKADQPISSLELLYPILQGYDSVAIRADVELGGTDQKFNLLFGRDIQRAYEVPEQSIMTLPILPGIDGVRRMSKSLDNYVGVTDPPEEMFGKLMRVPDEAMGTYYELLLGEPAPTGPAVEAKRSLARQIVDRFHGDGAGSGAEARFDQVHVFKGVPDDVEDLVLDPYVETGKAVHMPKLLGQGFGMSSSEARRLIDQGGVKVDGKVLAPGEFDVDPSDLEGRVIQVGKRKFKRLVSP
jgi:tyrosyl-tRNA synthetase